MPYVIKTIGIILAIAGVMLSTMPGMMTRIIDYMKQGKRVYVIGVGRVIIGALLLVATPQASLPWIPGAIGALIVISGILVFALGEARNHAFMDWWESKPEATRRLGAIVAAVLGVFLIYGA